MLTGAGVSTDSGIPDYRGEGAPPRAPMTFQQFLASETSRKRYWAGSHRGWGTFMATTPNAGHRALASLEASGRINGVVTQNVDGLHVRAGSTRVIDVHGSMSRVFCLVCGQAFNRDSVEEQLLRENPRLDEPGFVVLAPDGDADVSGIENFVVPTCSVCAGMLKPDVVFFGELVPRKRFAAAQALLTESSGLLVLGSSLAVNTGVRLVEQSRRAAQPVIIVNRGATKGDAKASIRVESGTTEFLLALADRAGVPIL
ncbi:hypothetical protein GCM10022198_03640 [Klugiella xanthotipulae]